MHIGILGGSFNPAHEGHLYISEHALKLLDKIWWLVSPQNPLKDTSITAPYEQRLVQAQQITAENNRIDVSSFEQENQIAYTHDSIEKMKQLHPEHNFYWLMGDDNLEQFHKWHRWQDIMQIIPIIVFKRGNVDIHKTRMADEFSSNYIKTPSDILDVAPPCWTFINIKPHSAASSKIRIDQAN